MYRILFTLLPHHLISRVVGWLANSRAKPIKSLFIKWFIKHYGVNMDEAKQPDPNAYENFNAFFTRQLADDARIIADNPRGVISPVDGVLSELGRVEHGKLLQAKGEYYQLEQLLADPQKAEQYHSASFVTLYLSPKDYHRIHMPVSGTLTHMTYVPGRLFAVNEASVGAIPNLFARNERVIAYFDTEFGPMAMVLVGAMIVASIVTSWAGVIEPGRSVQQFDYKNETIRLAKAEEMGQFQLGSTVIMLFANDNLNWPADLTGTTPVKMGQLLAEL